jgi:hypothetical protein
MRCGKCYAENPDDKRFCGDCGEPLGNRCSQCGAENPSANRFCGGWGAALTISAPISTSSAPTDVRLSTESASPEDIVGERKIE